MILKFVLVLFALCFSSMTWASIDGTLTLSGQQFALEENPSVSSQIDAHFRTPDFEARLHGFVETGTDGDWNLDLDPLVYRYQSTAQTEWGAWIGRAHPQTEIFGTVPTPQNATSVFWSQNQTMPLESRVSGWLGVGGKLKLPNHFFFAAQYSPIFLPNFGPALTLSEDEAPRGSRFADVPPLTYNMNGTLLPMRYKVKIDSLSEIVFQDQAFLGFGVQGNPLHWLASVWTTPSTSPEINPSGKLRVTESDTYVLVTAEPNFPRHYFVGSQLSGTWGHVTPKLGVAHDFTNGRWVVSSEVLIHVTDQSRITVGFTDELTSSSARYENSLLWTQAEVTALDQKLIPSVRAETHLEQGDFWIRPQVLWHANKRLALFARVDLLAGQEGSYFGAWRSLDRVAMGTHWVW